MGRFRKKGVKQQLKSFFDTCTTGRAEEIKKRLTEEPELLHMRDDENWGALHFAVMSGQEKVVTVLLNWGADPNEPTHNGKTPLYIAVRSGELRIVERLIERGAEPWRAAHHGRTALFAAIDLAASDFTSGLRLINILLYHRKFTPESFRRFVNHRNSDGLTALSYAKERFGGHSQFSELFPLLEKLNIPQVEHEINILLHGWNDRISDWEEIERNFNAEGNSPFYLFVYDSLANRVSIATLALDLYNFIQLKVMAYRRRSQRQSFLAYRGSETTHSGELKVSVNIICYSTGALVVRTFLQKYYFTEFRSVIDRVIFLAPANMGSPFAKFGKSHVGRLYTGQKKLGSFLECGEEFLTSLEPNSPFIWDLAQADVFAPADSQFFVPSEIMSTIIQGTKHYPKNLTSKVTRGNMIGSDGTVTISGASLQAEKYHLNLMGGAREEISVESATTDVALRLHPAHTHRSLIDSLVQKTDVFYLVRRALETTRDVFLKLQQSFSEENEIVYSDVHAPANLLLFKCLGHAEMEVIPLLYFHSTTYRPKLGQRVHPQEMQIEDRSCVLGPKIREMFSNTEHHSRDRHMFYKIVDLWQISKLMQVEASTRKQAVSLALCIKGATPKARVFGSTSWLDTSDTCFHSCDIGKTLLFMLAPVHGQARELLTSSGPMDTTSNLAETDNSTFAIKSLRQDACLEDTLNKLQTPGLIHLCTIFVRDGMMDQFLTMICRDRVKDLSGRVRALVVRALVPFFPISTEFQEACVALICTITSPAEISAFKEEMDRDHSVVETFSLYSSLPSPVACETLHHLVFSLLQTVPHNFLRTCKVLVNERHINRHQPQYLGVTCVGLDVMVIEHIFTQSDAIEADPPPMKFLVFVEDVVQPEKDAMFASDALAYPGVNAFLSHLCGEEHVVAIKWAQYQKPLLLEEVDYIVLHYQEQTVESIKKCVTEYLSLYPEYVYTIVAANSPLMYQAVQEIYAISPGAWALFRDLKGGACPSFAQHEEVDETFTGVATWAEAALEAYELELIPDPALVVQILRVSVEELQAASMRKQLNDSVLRWAELLQAAERIQEMIRGLPNGLAKITCRLAITFYHRLILENFVSRQISNEGLHMLLEVQEWLKDAPPAEPLADESASCYSLLELCQAQPAARALFERLLELPKPQPSTPILCSKREGSL